MGDQQDSGEPAESQGTPESQEIMKCCCFKQLSFAGSFSLEMDNFTEEWGPCGQGYVGRGKGHKVR